MAKNIGRGVVQAHVARAMAQCKINRNSKSESKAKAAEIARKALGDKEDNLRTRRTLNWLLNPKHGVDAAALKEMRERITAQAKSTARKPAPRKAPASAEAQAAA